MRSFNRLLVEVEVDVDFDADSVPATALEARSVEGIDGRLERDLGAMETSVFVDSSAALPL